jgi:hypothetical protein
MKKPTLSADQQRHYATHFGFTVEQVRQVWDQVAYFGDRNPLMKLENALMRAKDNGTNPLDEAQKEPL